VVHRQGGKGRRKDVKEHGRDGGVGGGGLLSKRGGAKVRRRNFSDDSQVMK